MKDLVELLSREWVTIAATPLTFALTAVFVSGLAYAASRWRHGGIIELLRERLTSKDEQISEYRERLHLVPADGGVYAKQSHRELQTEALKFVASLREWLTLRGKQDSDRQDLQWTAMTRATDETQRKILWDSHTADLISSGRTLKSEYDTKFKVKAIVLRDELLSRVTHPDPTSQAFSLYDHPTNSIGMGMVADDLERLARLLK